MRLPRRASLLPLALLLTSAATAHAESKWILWNHRGQNWDRVSTSNTWKECEDGRPRFSIPTDGTLLVDSRVPGWCCLPDTVNDPGGAAKAARDIFQRTRLDALSEKDRDAVLVIAPCW